MATKVVYLKSIGEVTFFRNRRSRRMRISVRPDRSVMVSFPYFVSEKDVLVFLNKSEEWICNQQKNFNENMTTFKEDSVLKTKLHTVRFIKGAWNNVECNGEVVKLTVENFDSDEGREVIEDVLTRIYRYEAKLILPERLQQLAKLHGFKYNKVTVRNNRRNWGSCSSKNNISLNLKLMKLPDELIDYILLHELVHTEIKDHSNKFWDRLNHVTNFNAMEFAKKVKQYSTYAL